MRIVDYRAPRALLCVLVTLVVSLRQPGRAEEPNSSRVEASGVSSAAAKLSQAFRKAASRAAPGVVTVYSMRGPRMTPEWRRTQVAREGRRLEGNDGPPVPMQSQSFTDDQGSGLVIDRTGLILTCNHVVASADALMVVLPDGRGFEATEVRGDPVTDLAVIRIEGAGDLHEVQFGKSDDVRAGDWAVTLANPFELNRSLSAGVVSATDRWVSGIHHPLIQFDASTNPGSSGGALLNLQGEVIGIISGSLGQSERFQGIGMAVPVDVAKRAIARLDNSPEAQHGYLGCQTKLLSPTVGKQLGLPAAGALYVEDVAPGSPAEKDGLREGDVITHVSGHEVDEPSVKEVIAEEVMPGQTYPFTVVRAGKVLTVNVQMGTMPGGYVPSPLDSQPLPQPSPDHTDQRLGLSLDRLDPGVARALGFPEDTAGVLVSNVKTGGLAYREGIAAGMVVIRINDFPTLGVASYKRATTGHSDGMPLLMLLQSTEGKHLVVFEGIAR